MSGFEMALLLVVITFEAFAYIKEVGEGSCKGILKTEFLKHVCRVTDIIMPVIQMKFLLCCRKCFLFAHLSFFLI